MSAMPAMENRDCAQAGEVLFVETGTQDENVGYLWGDQIHVARGWYVELWLKFNSNTLVFEELCIEIMRARTHSDWQDSRQILAELESSLDWF